VPILVRGSAFLSIMGRYSVLNRWDADEAPVRAAFRRCLKVAKILRHPRLHDLRHTYASLTLQRGVPLLVVSRQLGHASIAITADIYGVLVPEATRAAATAFEAILTTPRRNPDATPATEHS
jgi:integrase